MRIRRQGEEGRLKGDRAFSTKLQFSILLFWVGDFQTLLQKLRAKLILPLLIAFQK